MVVGRREAWAIFLKQTTVGTRLAYSTKFTTIAMRGVEKSRPKCPEAGNFVQAIADT
jgi:hypothetical protein